MQSNIILVLTIILFYNTLLIYAYNDVDDKNLPDIFKSPMCQEKLCIRKCCNIGEFTFKNKTVDEMTCVKGYEKEYPHVRIYNDNMELVSGELTDVFNILPGKYHEDDKFMKESYDVSHLPGLHVYLKEKGVLTQEIPNAFRRWTHFHQNDFCLDYQVAYKNNTPKFRFGFWINMTSEKPAVSNLYLTFAIWLSCFFLLLVLIVYGLLPELRNLCGMILMACVASMFWAFFLLTIIQVANIPIEACLGLTYTIYFFFLATFCWMNVMSYDIWWTFRGYAKARPIHRRGERFKFMMYSIYAWGLPLAMTIALAVVNKMDFSHLPWFITPKIPLLGCFIEGGAKLLYLYVPMLILILCNWLFFLMTAFNLWRLNRGTAVLDSAAAGTPQAHRQHKYRFLLYLKLSVVMGLNWALEVVSFVYPNFKVWYISDAYNILIGVAIFLIFVCKPKILKKLMKVYRTKKFRWTSYMSRERSNSSTDSSSSQETQTLQVCLNPRGPGYQMKAF